jgi:hypothetical protein
MAGISGAGLGGYENPRWRIPLAKRPGYEFFGHALGGLREHLPAPYPVIVRTGRLGDAIDGQCVRRARRFVVMLDRKLSCDQAVEALIHEWAHARAWNHRLDRAAAGKMALEDFEAIAHGGEFGVAYAECWRTLVTRIVPGWMASLGSSKH